MRLRHGPERTFLRQRPLMSRVPQLLPGSRRAPSHLLEKPTWRRPLSTRPSSTQIPEHPAVAHGVTARAYPWPGTRTPQASRRTQLTITCNNKRVADQHAVVSRRPGLRKKPREALHSLLSGAARRPHSAAARGPPSPALWLASGSQTWSFPRMLARRHRFAACLGCASALHAHRAPPQRGGSGCYPRTASGSSQAPVSSTPCFD